MFTFLLSLLMTWVSARGHGLCVTLWHDWLLVRLEDFFCLSCDIYWRHNYSTRCQHLLDV